MPSCPASSTPVKPMTVRHGFAAGVVAPVFVLLVMPGMPSAATRAAVSGGIWRLR
jgi:hypothetical protein